MLNTLRLSFSLKNTYRVNAILHSLKQIPLLKRLLPETLYPVSYTHLDQGAAARHSDPD